MLDKLKAGTSLADVAAASGLKVVSATELKRGEGKGPLSAQTVEAIFRTAKDGVGKGAAAVPGEQVVFRVTNIVVPTLDAASKEAKQLTDTLNRGLSEDLFSEYIVRLESEIGVSINQGALTQVISGGPAGDAN